MKRGKGKSDAQAGGRVPGDIEHMYRLPFPTPQTMAHASRVAVRSDDKIYSADTEGGANGSTLFVARHARSGEVDDSFGRGGWVAEYVEVGIAKVIDLLPRDGGGVLAVIRFGSNVSFEVALVCFTEGGELDLTFGEGGKLIYRIPLPESSTEPASSQEAGGSVDSRSAAASGGKVAVAEDGAFYCLLGSWDGPFYALIRFRADGQLDASFNGTGFVVDGEPAYRQWGATGMAVAADGRVTIAGLLYNLEANPIRRLAVWRLNPDGALDRSFGDDGYAFFDADIAGVDPGNVYQMYFFDAANLAEGGVTVCGEMRTRSGSVYQAFGMLGCLDDMGRPLDTFNRGKFLLFGVIGQYDTDFRGGLGVQRDGKIVVGGGVGDSPVTHRELMVARFQSSGMIDSTFAHGGTKRFRWDDAKVNYMSDLLVDANGKILVAGSGGANNDTGSMQQFVCQLSGE